MIHLAEESGTCRLTSWWWARGWGAWPPRSAWRSSDTASPSSRRTAQAGGRCNRIEVDGFKFDTGPTLLLMPDVLAELFASAGRDVAQELDLRQLDPNYRIFFHDGSDIDLSSNLATMAEGLERLEPGSSEAYFRFLAEAGGMYRVSRSHFVERNFRTAAEFFTPRHLKLVLEVKALKNLYKNVSTYFKDDRLRRAFSFQTMYLGISPFASPAVYSLLPYTELVQGIWFPMGGMYAIVEALGRVADDLGVTVRLGAPVDRVVYRDGRASGVRLEDGEVVAADVVLINADLPYAYESLLGEHATSRYMKKKFTASAVMVYLGCDRRYDHLPHHNAVFGEGYRETFTTIFDKLAIPDDPSFYVCRPTATDPSLAPPGKDIIYLLIPVPYEAPGQDWQAGLQPLLDSVYDRCARQLGMADLKRQTVVSRRWMPSDWREQFNLAKGSAFGLSHDFAQVGYFRPSNRHAKVSNLYFVGASTQPGTGVPMVFLSSRLVAERMIQEQPPHSARVVPRTSFEPMEV